jgi:hypothetical protein
MNRRWTVERRWIDHPDAQRRWDRAYQLLLDVADPAVGPPTEPESRHADRRLCPCLDTAPSPGTDN